jgi:hypothetical protein
MTNTNKNFRSFNKLINLRVSQKSLQHKLKVLKEILLSRRGKNKKQETQDSENLKENLKENPSQKTKTLKKLKNHKIVKQKLKETNILQNSKLNLQKKKTDPQNIYNIQNLYSSQRPEQCQNELFNNWNFRKNNYNKVELGQHNNQEIHFDIFPSPNNHKILHDKNKKNNFIRLTESEKNNDSKNSFSVIRLDQYIKNELYGIDQLGIAGLFNKITNLKKLLDPISQIQDKYFHFNKFKEYLNKNKTPDLINIPKIKNEKEESLLVEKNKSEDIEPEKTIDMKLTQSRKSSRKAKIIPIPSNNQSKQNKVKKRSKNVKGCKCNHSKCLRLHCVCFKNNIFCSPSCGCKQCYNTESHLEIVEKVNRTTKEINPHAFESKIFEVEIDNKMVKITRGCNCTQNNCLKNYCQCKKIGLVCSSLCRCTSCKNEKVILEPALASRLSKRKSRKKKKIILETINEKVLNVMQVNLNKDT